MYIVRSHTATSHNASARKGLDKGLSKLLGTTHIQKPLPTSGSNMNLTVVGDKHLLAVVYSSATPDWLYKAGKQEMMRRTREGWMNKAPNEELYPNLIIEILTTPDSVEVIR